MSVLATDAITDASGGNTATINSYTPTESNMAGRNRIINGDMRIDQRNAGALVAGAAGNIYGVDRFPVGVFGAGTGRISTQQSSTTPTGFVKSLVNTVTTADAAPPSAYGYCVFQRIEGNNTADLMWGTSNAQPITISFWVRSSLTGNYVISTVNNGVTWGYSTTYTINTANTWEYKTITIDGATSGTWETDSNVGIGLIFGLGGGADRQATLNSWYAPTGTNTPTDATGCVDWIATSGATFYLTGVQLEVGSVATPFERRFYGQELQLAQRYYQKTGGYFAATQVTSELYATGSCGVKVDMRANPTATLPAGGGRFHKPGIAFYAISAVDAGPQANGDGYQTCTIAAGAGAGTTGQLDFGLILSAEL
jgi:hypothetical protein